MGLLRAGLGAAGGVMADQWKEFIYCESMPADVLACKGSKRTGGRSSNTRGEDNVISNGSVIAVNDGQGMLVVQNGKIIEVALEPGEFVFDTGSEPSVFSGNLGDSIKETFANIGSRFTFGGDAGKDQRVYFINTKEIIGNKYGTASPVPFRVVDNNIGLDVDISVRCNGEYSYRITNPLLFFPLIVVPLIVLLVLEIRHMIKTTQEVARAEDEAALRAAVEQIREKRRSEQEGRDSAKEQNDGGHTDESAEADPGALDDSNHSA